MNILRNIIDILLVFFKRRETNLKLLLSDYLNRNNPKDRNRITHAVYGIVRNQLYLEFVIERFSKKDFGSLSPKTRILLLAGIYFILLSSSYPDHAVVNEIVKYTNPGIRSFVNAILRTVIRNRNNPELKKENMESMHIRYSGSSYYIQKLNKISKDSPEIYEYFDTPPVFHILNNPLKISREDAVKLLKSSGIQFKEIEELGTFEIKSAGKIIKDFVKEGIFYFQNTGSQLISLVASEFSSKTVLDCCAAPGSKSVTLGLQRPELKIVANDIRPGRTAMINDFIRKFKIKNIFPVTSDTRKFPFRPVFDMIIADVPCSSSGTIRKNPDLKLNLTKKKIDLNKTIQESLLESILISAAGESFILYSVCSFINEESEGVLEKTLNIVNTKDRNFKYSTVSLKKMVKSHGFNIKNGKYGIFTLPSRRLNNDIFYISVILKKRKI